MFRRILPFLAIFVFATAALADPLNVTFISQSPTVDTSAYASGDTIGAKMTFTGVCSMGKQRAQILGVQILDKAKQSADIDVVLFNTSAPGGTYTDNAAITIADANLPNIQAEISITTHKTFNDNSISYSSEVIRPVMCDTPGNLYGYMISRGTPTYAASDLTVVLLVSPD